MHVISVLSQLDGTNNLIVFNPHNALVVTVIEVAEFNHVPLLAMTKRESSVLLLAGGERSRVSDMTWLHTCYAAAAVQGSVI